MLDLIYRLMGYSPAPQQAAPEGCPDRQLLLAIMSAKPRSSRWSTVRDAFVKAHPACAACGSKDNLNVHHIRPYHVYPELELDRSNLIVLCEGPVVNCHFLFGHMRNWKSWNPNVVLLARSWADALKAAKGDGSSVPMPGS